MDNRKITEDIVHIKKNCWLIDLYIKKETKKINSWDKREKSGSILYCKIITLITQSKKRVFSRSFPIVCIYMLVHTYNRKTLYQFILSCSVIYCNISGEDLCWRILLSDEKDIKRFLFFVSSSLQTSLFFFKKWNENNLIKNKSAKAMERMKRLIIVFENWIMN